MPYKHQGAYHDAIREYLKHLRPPNAQSERGVVRQKTIDEYRGILFEAGRLLGWPNPRGVTLEEMRSLEPCISGTSERTMAKKLSVIRAFLRYHGNADAMRWRIAKHPAPYRGGVFLNERQVTRLHMEARKLGPLAELVVSLAVDNGLRTVDINRLTMENAREFLDTGNRTFAGRAGTGARSRCRSSPLTPGPSWSATWRSARSTCAGPGAGSSRLVLKLVTVPSEAAVPCLAQQGRLLPHRQGAERQDRDELPLPRPAPDPRPPAAREGRADRDHRQDPAARGLRAGLPGLHRDRLQRDADGPRLSLSRRAHPVGDVERNSFRSRFHQEKSRCSEGIKYL